MLGERNGRCDVLWASPLPARLTLSAKADLQFLGAVDFGNGPNDPGTNRNFSRSSTAKPA